MLPTHMEIKVKRYLAFFGLWIVVSPTMSAEFPLYDIEYNCEVQTRNEIPSFNKCVGEEQMAYEYVYSIIDSVDDLVYEKCSGVSNGYYSLLRLCIDEETYDADQRRSFSYHHNSRRSY